MIRSYRDKRTKAVANGKAPEGFPSDLAALLSGNCS